MKKLIISMKTMLCYTKYCLRMMAVLCIMLGSLGAMAQTTPRSNDNANGNEITLGSIGDNNEPTRASTTIDFETVNFNQITNIGASYTNDASYPWTIVSNTSHNGTYSIKSGNGDINSSTSAFQITVTYAGSGTISFFGKVSSESGYDFGHFYIDGIEQTFSNIASSGTSGDFTKGETYNVSSGQHTFKWTFTKDISSAAGDDCFYVDDIYFSNYAPPVNPPSNSTCATATSLPCGTSNLAGTTVNTTGIAHGLPSNAQLSNYGVWYKFTGDGGNTTISVTSGSGFDGEVAVVSGSCGSFTWVGSNDNGGTAGTDTYTFTTTSGTNYFVYVAYYGPSGNNSNTGNFTISRTCPPPANATCATATSLPCGTSNLAGTTVNTTGTAHGLPSSASLSNYGVWYTFTGDDRPTTISVKSGSGFDGEIAVVSGSCGSFTWVGSNDDGGSGGTDSFTFTSVSGTTYYVYVAHYSSGNTTTGNFTISRECTTITAPTVTTNSEVTRRPSTSIIGCGGNLTSTGGGETERGICYIVGTSGTPTYSDNKVSAGNTTSTGSFTVDLTGLTPNTSYRCRAYAKNSAGTAYGETCTFTTHWLTQDSGTAGAATSEYSEKLFDYSTGTKWCVTSVSNTYVIFHADRPVIPQQYIFTTANDGLPARNPKDWTISGANELLSESSSSWTTIETVTGNTEMPSTTYTSHTFNMQECPAQAYQYFKFKVTAVQSGNTFQLSELDLVPYPITCTPSQASPSNGYIEATTWPAVAGNSVTIKIHPASGYKLGTITAYKTGDSGTTVTLTGSGDTDGSTRTFTMPGYDVTVSASFVLDSYTITVNTNTGTYGSVSGSGTYADGSTQTITATANANGYFYKWSDGNTNASRTITVTGNATYTAIFVPKNISSTTDWDNFAAAVSGTGNYSGNAFNYSSKTVYLTANVGQVTTIVGTTGNLSFQGTFDGQCHTLTIYYTSTDARCAPFHTADNATFQNLKIAGTINTSHIQAAGLVGYVNNNCAITNCVSDVTISSSINGKGVIGGFIGEVDSQGHVTITGSAFTGKLLGVNTNKCAGFVGFNYSYYSAWTLSGSATVSFTDCIFAPAEVTMGVGSGYATEVKSATFARSFASSSWSQDSSEGLTFNNCYYTQSFGTVQGTQCYSITPGSNTTVALTGTTTGHNYAASCSDTGLVFYDNEDANSTCDNGFSYNNGSTTTLYAAGNVTANLLLGSEDVAGSTFFYYSATPGTLSGNAATGTDDPYTLTMTADNQTITANYVNQTTSNDWTKAVDDIGDVPTGGILSAVAMSPLAIGKGWLGLSPW